MPLQLDIVTPEKKAFSDEVDTVVVPGVEGEFGVLPSHAPLVSTLAPGELRYLKAGEEFHLAIGTGVVEVSHDRISVLTDMAMEEHEIDEDAVEEALARAEKALQEKTGPEDTAAMQAMIQKNLAQLRLKRRRRLR